MYIVVFVNFQNLRKLCDVIVRSQRHIINELITFIGYLCLTNTTTFIAAGGYENVSLQFSSEVTPSQFGKLIFGRQKTANNN